MKLRLTTVFEKTWKAIHDLDDNGERKWRYIVHEGSSRSSKTMSLIDVMDLYARANENKRITVWRDTKIDCKKTVFNDIKKLLSMSNRWQFGFKFNKTETILSYETNSTFEIHGTDDENTVHGLTQDVAWLNEPYKISQATFDQIDQRTSDFVIVDWNPKMSHVWIDRLKKDPRCLVIHSTFEDNPFCPIEQRRKILSYKPISYCIAVQQKLRDVQSLLNGDLTGLPLKVYNDAVMCLENELKGTASEYNWCVYGLGMKAERPNRIFKWKKISYHDYLTIPENHMLYASDWGVVDPWGIVEIKYFDGGLYLHEKNYLSENDLRSKMRPADLARIQQDPDGLVKNHFSQLGIGLNKIIVCDNNRPNKIKALRQSGYEYAVAAVKGKIADGISLLLDMPVYYTDASKNLEAEQENYSWKVDRYGVILDEPEDLNNHLIDSTRYGAEYLRTQGIIKKV